MSLFLVLAMVSNGAFAGSLSTEDQSKMIARSFDEFRYRMTVEVDPSNKNQQADAADYFKRSIEKLQAQGVSTDQIVEYMKRTVLDQSSRDDFERLVSAMEKETISSAEASNLMVNFMSAKYQNGANYKGGQQQGGYRWVSYVVIVGVIAFIYIQHRRGIIAFPMLTQAQE